MSSLKDPTQFYNELQSYQNDSNTYLNTFFYTIDSNYINDVDKCYDCKNVKNSKEIETCKSKSEINKIDEINEIDPNFTTYKSNIENLRNLIEQLRIEIIDERKTLAKNMNDMRNNEHFATTLNSDYSEIYKYKYLRNWGIFLSILGGAYFFKKMK